VGGGRLLLGQQAADRRDRFDDDAAAAQLAKLIERRREELQREAMKLAHRLLRKKPGKVVRPLEKRTPPRSWVWDACRVLWIPELFSAPVLERLREKWSGSGSRLCPTTTA
jgi:hypothetical protein